ncbi:hypothetical protein HMPREF0731_0614 [Pseudoroseomonas cervicalis ATCC 49957]|uniref:Uncharacterized protein n=1 Tax=Pseudoroseomonas cervicalis ATCC 49957 TaxID=525371 RepID=D5RHQ4_9PROT|nr:hypothetical protein HMPREF0731_0614 [Pseudoroseomonas cervicalis ATCC 49957]
MKGRVPRDPAFFSASSFSEEKEAKRLSFSWRPASGLKRDAN